MPRVEHHRRECVHGVLISQCRCPGPRTRLVGLCPPACVYHGVRPDVVDQSLARHRSQLDEEERYARMQEAEL